MYALSVHHYPMAILLRYPYTDNLSLPYMLYFCVVVVICIFPLLFRCVLLIVRSASKYDFTFFVKKKKGSKKSTIHLSPYADTRCPKSMRKHWDVLLSLISKAINNDEIIVMHSHLFTPARINKLIKRLKSYDLSFSVITYPRKTSLYEKLSIPFIYLLFQWSFRICIRTEWQSSFVLSSRLTSINKLVYTNTESPLWKKLSDTYTAVIIVRLCRNFRRQ